MWVLSSPIGDFIDFLNSFDETREIQISVRFDDFSDKERYGDEYENVKAFTFFNDNSEPEMILISVRCDAIQMMDALLHEVGHVLVGYEHEHDVVWEMKCDEIYREYVKYCNKIAEACGMEVVDAKTYIGE